MILQVDSWLVIDKQLHFPRFHYLELFKQYLYTCFLTCCIWCIHILNFTWWQSHNALLPWAPRNWRDFDHEHVVCNTLLSVVISTKVWISVTIYFCICVGLLLPCHQQTMINRTFDVSQHYLDCSETTFLGFLYEFTQQSDTLTNVWSSIAKTPQWSNDLFIQCRHYKFIICLLLQLCFSF